MAKRNPPSGRRRAQRNIFVGHAEELLTEPMSMSEPEEEQISTCIPDASREDGKIKYMEIAPLEFRNIPFTASENFRRPAFAYTPFCQDQELRRLGKVKEERFYGEIDI